MKTHKLKVRLAESHPSHKGALIELDGAEIRASGITITAGVDMTTKVTITLPVCEVELEADVLLGELIQEGLLNQIEDPETAA